jgi:hypothetical protein
MNVLNLSSSPQPQGKLQYRIEGIYIKDQVKDSSENAGFLSTRYDRLAACESSDRREVT